MSRSQWNNTPDDPRRRLQELRQEAAHSAAREKQEDHPAKVENTRRGSPWQGCELILTAAPVQLAPRGEETTIKFLAHEPGQADLGRLLIYVYGSTDGRSFAGILDEAARITSIELFNSHQRVRGLGYVEAPAGVFSTLRRHTAIDLGTVALAAGDTLAVTIRVDDPAGEASTVALAVPFQPESTRHLSRDAARAVEPHAFVVSPPRRWASREPFTLTVTFEEDGVVDLGSLQIAGTLRGTPRQSPRDIVPSTLAESIRLPSGEDLIVGAGDCYDESLPAPLAVPATLFTHLERVGHWVHLGPLKVLRGQQISIRLRRSDADGELAEATFSAGMRFYFRSETVFAGGRVRPSDFFTPILDDIGPMLPPASLLKFGASRRATLQLLRRLPRLTRRIEF